MLVLFLKMLIINRPFLCSSFLYLISSPAESGTRAAHCTLPGSHRQTQEKEREEGQEEEEKIGKRKASEDGGGAGTDSSRQDPENRQDAKNKEQPINGLSAGDANQEGAEQQEEQQEQVSTDTCRTMLELHLQCASVL